MRLSTTLSPYLKNPDGTLRPLSDVIRDAADDGFAVLDFPLHAVPFLADGEDWRAPIREALDAADALGVRFGYAHLPFDFPAEDDTAGWERFDRRVRRAIEAAAALGVGQAAIHGHCPPRPNYSYDRSFAHVCGFLAPYAALAREAGVGLCVENMIKRAMTHLRRFGETPEDILAAADALDIGVCLDTGHANCSGLDVADAVRKLGPRLRMVHINDNLGLGDDHLPPFLGNADWRAIFAALRECGYPGDCNFEVNTRHIPPALLHGFMRSLHDTGAYLLTL